MWRCPCDRLVIVQWIPIAVEAIQQGLICAIQPLAVAFIRHRYFGHANTDGGLDIEFVMQGSFANHFSQPFCNAVGAVEVTISHQNDEFLTPVTTADVGLTRALLDTFGKCTSSLILTHSERP